MWVTQSGVPTANAPFSIPARKTNPLLVYPVSLFQSFQTKAFEAYPLPVLLGMTAHTTMVTNRPPRIRNQPSLLIMGRILLANMTVKHAPQQMIRYAAKTCDLLTS